jgi:hypothetical protein
LSLGWPVVASAQDKGGQAVSRGGDSGGGGAVSRGGGDSGGSVSRGGGDSGGSVSRGGGDSGGAVSRPSGGDRSGGTVSRPSSPGTRAPITSEGSSRPREDRPPVGRAIPRPAESPGAPGSSGSSAISTVYYGGYYPWGYGGLGLGGYYGWYDPWWYDPYYYGGGYGYGRSSYFGSPWDGGLRLKVKPSDAEVYVDGYFAGIVDEFDNAFQRLRIDSGPHRIEVRREGFEPLSFEVRILPDRTITYRGELKRLP